jgi:hypothetical protein
MPSYPGLSIPTRIIRAITDPKHESGIIPRKYGILPVDTASNSRPESLKPEMKAYPKCIQVYKADIIF